jgi:hypothetical protein
MRDFRHVHFQRGAEGIGKHQSNLEVLGMQPAAKRSWGFVTRKREDLVKGGMMQPKIG